MKPNIPTTLSWGLLLLLAAWGQAPAEQTVGDLPASEPLIEALPHTNSLPISAVVQGLIEWPSLETLNSQQARQDRSQTIPPLFPQPKIRDAKPIRLGAQSPQAACKEAAQWILQVLKPQWVPGDLTNRLHTLQREPASQSIVACRYLINGHAIQINQSRGSMWAIVRPPKGAPLSQNAEELAKAIFNTYFLQGDRMASLQLKEITAPARLRAWAPDFSAAIPAGALENWWGWRLWLTDGQAVAVFLGKTSEDSARTILPDDPWF
jgi:hypothetical protein